MGTYLEDNGYQEGWAVWKFVFQKNVVYRNKNQHAMKVYWKNRDRHPFTVYVRTVNGWEFVANISPSEKCKCGLRYDETPNGEVFKFQEHPLVYTIEAICETMRSPVLCMVCYYSNELKEGRWAPKYVRRILGLET